MKLRVGLCYNRYKDFPVKKHHPSDIAIEWSDEKYIDLLKNGLVTAGFEVKDIGKPTRLTDKNIRKDIDVVFSIAEMEGYRFRESIVGVLCELYKLPYTFSAPDAMMNTLDKHYSNLMIRDTDCKVPNWLLISDVKELDQLQGHTFPCIVKPNGEGSSMGISQSSVVRTATELIAQTRYCLENYEQPALIQEFIEGQEVTVGVIEKNKQIVALTPLLTFDDIQAKHKVFDFPTKISYKTQELFKVFDHALAPVIQEKAQTIFNKIGCRDAARVDFRIRNLEPYFIEINGLTDFHPKGDFCLSAKHANIDYPTLLKTIVLNAYSRYKPKFIGSN